jgi:L-rhamnose mutarotase
MTSLVSCARKYARFRQGLFGGRLKKVGCRSDRLNGAVAMKRIGFLLKVKKEKLEEYKKHHQIVWPEMLEALRQAGWHNYSIFVREDGLLFGYFETEQSLQAAQAKMAAKEVNTRWQIFMAPYFDSPDNARPDEMFLELDEIFHLD